MVVGIGGIAGGALGVIVAQAGGISRTVFSLAALATTGIGTGFGVGFAVGGLLA